MRTTANADQGICSLTKSCVIAWKTEFMNMTSRDPGRSTRQSGLPRIVRISRCGSFAKAYAEDYCILCSRWRRTPEKQCGACFVRAKNSERVPGPPKNFPTRLRTVADQMFAFHLLHLVFPD